MYKEGAIPLITWKQQQQKYIIQQEAAKLIQNLSKPIGIIAITGLCRTGKSYLLNKLILNRQSVFSVNSTNSNNKKGLWMWSTPLLGKTKQGNNINILIIDSQGIKEGQQQNKLVNLLAIISSQLIYNSMGALNKKSFEDIKIITNLRKFIKIKSQQQVQSESIDNYCKYFPNFMWTIRDFQIQSTQYQPKIINQKQYLENALMLQDQINNNTQQINQIKKLLKAYFIQRECITFIRPLLNQSYLHKLDKLGLQNVRPQFFQKIMVFRKQLLNNIKVKSIRNKQLDGQMYLNLIKSYIKNINEGRLIILQQVQHQIFKLHSKKNLQNCKQYHIKNINQQVFPKIPLVEKQLKQILKKISNCTLQKFESESLQENKFDLQQIKNFIKLNKIEIIQKNNIECRKFIQESIIKKFYSIQKKLKSNSFQNYHEFYKDLCLFQNSLQESIKYLDINQQIYNEFFVKVLKQISIHFFKIADSDFERYKKSREEQINQMKLLIDKNLREYNIQNQKSSQRIQKIQAQNSKLKQTIQIFQSKSEREKNSLIIQNQRLQTIKLKLEQKIDIQMKQSKQKYQNLQNQLLLIKTNLKNKIIQQQTMRQLVEKDNQNLIVQIDQKNKVIKKLENDLNMLKAENTKQIKQIMIKIDNQKKKYDEQMQILRQKIIQLHNSQSQLKQKYQRLILQKQIQIQKLRQNLENYQIYSEKNRNEEFRQNNSNIQKYITLNNEKNLLNNQNIQLQQEISRLKQQKKLQINNLNKQNAVLIQKYEFCNIELKLLQEKYNQLKQNEFKSYVIVQTKNNLNEMVQLQKIRNYENKIKNLENQYKIKLNNYQNQKQKIQNESDESKLRIKILQNELEKQIQQNKQNNLKQKKKNQQLQEKLKKLQSQNDYSTKQYKNYYEQKIMSLEEQIQRIRYESQLLKQDNHKKISQELIQIKNYHEQQKLYLNNKIHDQKQKNERKQKNIIKQIQDKYQQQMKILQNQNSQMIQRFTNTEYQYKQKINQYIFQIQLKQKNIQSLERELKYNQQSYEDNLTSFKQILQQKQKSSTEISFAYQQKIELLKQENTKFQTKLILIQSNLKQKEQNLEKLNLQLKNLNQSYIKLQQDTSNQLQKANQKYTKFFDETIIKQHELEKNYALSQQTNEFKQVRIKKLQNIIQSSNKCYQQKLSELKRQINNQFNEKTEEILKQKDKSYQKYSTIKKLYKQLQSKYNKNLVDDQKNKRLNNQKIVWYQNKIAQIENSIKIQIKQHNSNINTLKVQLNSTKLQYQSTIKQLQKKIQGLEIEKNFINNNYEKNSILWNSKFMFLQQQKQKMKNDHLQKVKKLEQLIEFLNKTKQIQRNSENLIQITNSIQRKSQLKINQLSQNHLKQILTCQEKIKLLQIQLKTQKQKNIMETNKIKNLYYEKNLNEMKENQKKLMKQIQKLRQQKQRRNFDHQKALNTQKEASKMKLRQIQEKLRENQKKKSYTLFEQQKQRAKWNQEKQNLKQTIRQLQDSLKGLKHNKQKLQKQNQIYKYEKKKMKASGSSSINSSMSRWQQSRFEKFKGTNIKDYSIFNSSDTKSPRSIIQQFQKENILQFVKLDDD